MNIQIENRHTINDAMRNARGKFAVIAISDPYDDPHGYEIPLAEQEPCKLIVRSNGFAGMLRLHFFDGGIENYHDEQLVFNRSHLEKVIAFVKVIARDCELLIVHCDKGISRSTAIALGISEMWGYIIINMPENARPNGHVLSIFRRALIKQENDRIH